MSIEQTPLTPVEALTRIVDKRTLTFEGDQFLVSKREMRYADEAFAELAPLSRGVIPVIVEDVAGPDVTPPPTDTQGAP